MEIFSYLGILLPAVIDLFNRKIQDSDIRFWVSFSFCSIAGIALNYFITDGSGFTTVNSAVADIFVTFGLSQFSYKGLWENSKVRTTLQLDATRQ